NIPVNITITGTPLFISVDYPSRYYQYKVDVNESGAFNFTLSTTEWTNMTNVSNTIDIRDLDWHDIHDTAETDIRIEVPPNEGAGTKISNVTFEVP
ncbi:hypothetical protein DRN74_06010, partial [Candidatus Micrarchaeota archaeon]